MANFSYSSFVRRSFLLKEKTLLLSYARHFSCTVKRRNPDNDSKPASSHRVPSSIFHDELVRKSSTKKTEEIQTDPVAIFHAAMSNAKPVVGVQSIKKAGKTYQVPTPLTPSRQRFLAMKWLIAAARDKPASRNAKMYEKLCQELLNAYNNEGTVVQKKRDLHKLAENNRAFANFRWW